MLDPEKMKVMLRVAEILENTKNEREGVELIAEFVLDREDAIRSEYVAKD